MIRWLCTSLGLPLIAESDAGALTLNAAAQDVFGEVTQGTMEAALRGVARDLELSTLRTALQRARLGQPTELAVGHELSLLVAPAGAGLACAVLAPARSRNDAALQRRALAADRTAHVSHELANALGAIAGWARLAKEGASVDEALELIEKSAELAWSAARTVLGELSGQSVDGAGAAVIDLSAFVDEAARLLIPKALTQQVTIRTSITPGLCIAGDRSSAWSIVWNLATNAIEALPSGGVLTLQLTATEDTVHLCVSDNGPGMTSVVRERVFEPYFTTKRSGTGLGLSMVKQAVVELGGRLDLESQPNQGTRFQIDLPRAMQAEKPRPRSHATGKRASGVFLAEHLDGDFLVLDDDATLREMIATALQMRGARVTACATLDEALAHRGPFKLAVVDLMLGDQRGDVALARLRASGTVRAGLLITGAGVPRKVVAGGEPDGILLKPFELQDLFEHVTEVLSRDRERHSAAG